MRLAGTTKYLFHRPLNERLFLVLLIFFVPLDVLTGQAFRHTFHNTPLSEALVFASKEYGIKVAFDSGKLGSVIIDKEISGGTIEEFLENMLAGTGFDYKFKYNRYLIIQSGNAGIGHIQGKGQIIGSVTDVESGESLPFASILFYDQNILTSATENGSFCLKNIISNPVHLRINYIGYNELDTAISWSDPLTNICLKLSKKEHILDTITVRGGRMEMIDVRNDAEFATTVNPSRLTDLPVLAETDVFRILQLLPGINYSENSSGMSIRGGSSDQNLVLFDGQTLYNLSHYYGVVSAINPNVIKDMQVYKGGYDSRFGERVSGIVDITGKSGNQLKPSVYGDINLLSGNISAELPLSPKLTFIGAFRRSYSDIYSTSLSKDLFRRNLDWFDRDSVSIVNQTQPDFRFYDYNAKLTFRPDNTETYALSVYGRKDSFRNSYTGTARGLGIDGYDRNTWSNYGLSATWMKQWNESFYSGFQAGTSGYLNNSTNQTIIWRSMSDMNPVPSLPDSVNSFKTNNINELSDAYFSWKGTYKISNSNQINSGFLLRINNILYYKDAGDRFIYDNQKQSGLTGSAYIQDKINLNNRLDIKPGLRLTYFNGTRKIYFEPRFSASYMISKDISVRLALGRYYQFLNQVMARQETGYNKTFWIMADDLYHPEVASNHFVAGILSDKGRFLFDCEAYIKTFSGLQEYIFVSQFLKNPKSPELLPGKSEIPPPDPSKPSFFLTGKGRSYGIDMLLRYKTKGYTGWISYSWGRSMHRFGDINNGEEIPSPEDIPHQLSITNMFTAGRWNFSTVSLFTSGRPYVDFTKEKAGFPLYRTYRRLPDYFRSDFSVNYSFSPGNFKFKTGVTLINIFNTQNYFNINTRKFDFENSSFSETTLIQSQAFSVNLFLHFMF